MITAETGMLGLLVLLNIVLLKLILSGNRKSDISGSLRDIENHT